MPDLLRRQRAIEQTMAKFKDRPFEWGHTDCARIMRSHLKAMGHRKLPRLPAYDSAAGAVKALKSMGHDSIESLLDAHLERIAPAKMLPGDLGILEGGGLDAVVICLGHKFFGFHEDYERPMILIPKEMKAAYRG